MLITILFSIISSDTVKLLIKRGTNYLLTATGTSIDSELAHTIMNDIAQSKGNLLAAENLDTLIKEL